MKPNPPISAVRVAPRSPVSHIWNQLFDVLGQRAFFLSAIMPSGDTSVVHASALADRVVRDSESDALINRLTWRSLADGPLDLTFQNGATTTTGVDGLASLGVAQWTTLVIPSYVLPGYPAVLHVYRNANTPAPTAVEMQQVRAILEPEDEMAEARAARLFVLDASSHPLLSVSAWEKLDPQVKSEAAAKAADMLNVIAGDKPVSHRAAHIGDEGKMVSIRYTAMATHPGARGGSAVTVALQPTVEEWININADDVPADREFGRFLPALKFIYDQSGNSPSLSSIARSVHLSQFHFHRKFAELIGMTPKQYLLECQIARAQTLLAAGGVELSKVAEQCGFAHQSHFTSRFKQATGMTPTRWRRLVTQSGN